jgi:hypothetical protein
LNPDNTAPCDDGDACTEDDVCGAGSCVSGPPPDCDPGDVCLIGSCDSVLGCVTEPNPACVSAVPALTPVAGAVLALGLAAAGAAARARRRSG